MKIWGTSHSAIPPRGTAASLVWALSLGLDPMAAVGALGELEAASRGFGGLSRRRLKQLRADLEGGKALDQALLTRSFPPTLVWAARAGLAAGDLSAAMRALWSQLTSDTTQERRLRAALSQQTLVFLIMLAALSTTYRSISTLLAVTIPAAPGAAVALIEAPLTWFRALLSVSAVLSLILGLAHLSPGMARHLRLVGVGGKRRLGFVPGPRPGLARLPWLRTTLGRELASRVARGLATLLDAGVGLPQALRLAAVPGLEDELETVARRTSDGVSLSTALESSDQLRPWLAWPARLGQASGDLAGVLAEASATLHVEATRRLDDTRRAMVAGLIVITALIVSAALILAYRIIALIPGMMLVNG